MSKIKAMRALQGKTPMPVIRKKGAPKRGTNPAPGGKLAARRRSAQGLPPKASLTTSPFDLKALYQQFEEDRARLKGLSIGQKEDLKRDELVEKYRAAALAYLEGGDEKAAKLAQYWVLWLFDAGLLEEFIRYSTIAQTKGLAPPEPFGGEWIKLKARLIGNWARQRFDEKESAEPYFSQVFDELQEQNCFELLDDRIRADFWYLRFNWLLMAKENAKAIEIGKVGLAEHGASIKTKLNHLIKAEAAKQPPSVDGSPA